MEKTLLIRIDGPVQSWPKQDSPADRSTSDMPTKHGVLRHIIAAAMGRDLGADISDLMQRTTFGVAVVRISAPLDDVEFFDDKDGTESSILSEAIADGIFIVGLSCEESFAGEVLYFLQHPMKEMSFGRDMYPVKEHALSVALSDEPLEKALLKAATTDPARRIHIEIEAGNTVETKYLSRIKNS